MMFVGNAHKIECSFINLLCEKHVILFFSLVGSPS